MRKCLRCETEMIENLKITPANTLASIQLKEKPIKPSAAPIEAALCPKCGYVETYIELNNREELEAILKKQKEK
ncbi:MAG: nucleic acid-binding protein [Erysipelotrichia bacterium]|nr:nucleic acid-binding protein [Erysipelotrichia bacterium]